MKLYSSPLRAGVLDVITRVRTNLLLASPYVKTAEVEWLLNRLPESGLISKATLITDVRVNNVLDGSLDLEALLLFSNQAPHAEVISLPHLHAKVYVADDDFALVTSANLTRGGLEFNYEYGVGVEETMVVKTIRADMEAYSGLGSAMDGARIASLKAATDDLKDDYQKARKKNATDFNGKLKQALASAEEKFLQAQVGEKSAHALFAISILYCLKKGPQTTRELGRQIQILLPDLCDDSRDLIINGQRFGKAWKHGVRNAQVFLRRKGAIARNGQFWELC